MTYAELARALADTPHVPCRDTAPEYWISDDPEDQALAARACQGCDLLEACRTYTHLHPEPAGVWGATTPSQRKALLERKSMNGNDTGPREPGHAAVTIQPGGGDLRSRRPHPQEARRGRHARTSGPETIAPAEAL